jgi:dipeptidyl aminopeptidase/acylaminoacyl peptidase
LRDGHAKFLSDGTKIIFNSQRDDEGTLELKNYELYEMNPDGSEIKRLTSYFEWDTYPSFSPDGKKVLWRRILADSTAPRGYNSEIFTMNRDGTDIRNLSNHPSFDGYPEWSPDGKRIIFVSSRHGQTTSHLQLFVMNADGSNIKQLTRNKITEEDVRPSWSPDGKKIVFNRDNPDGTRIYMMEVREAATGFYFNEVAQSSTALSGNSSRGLAWGDYNKDGVPDLLVANTMNNSNSLFENDTRGNFVQKTEGQEVTSAGWTEGAFFIDFDNDGDLDIFSGGGPLTEGEHLWLLWENVDGVGGQWNEHVLQRGMRTHESVCGDVDGDGDIDLLTKPWNGDLHLFAENLLIEGAAEQQ